MLVVFVLTRKHLISSVLIAFFAFFPSYNQQSTAVNWMSGEKFCSKIISYTLYFQSFFLSFCCKEIFVIKCTPSSITSIKHIGSRFICEADISHLLKIQVVIKKLFKFAINLDFTKTPSPPLTMAPTTKHTHLLLNLF